MEAGLGRSLAGVRLHTDHSAAQAAQRHSARAFAYGQHIGFASNEFRPGTLSGELMIAHELAHTIQQRGAQVPEFQAAGDTDSAAERDANRSAAAAVGTRFGLANPAPPREHRGLSLHRCNGNVPSDYGVNIPAPPKGTALLGSGFTVDPTMMEGDKVRKFLDPADKVAKPVYTENAGYVKNPAAAKLATVISGGKLSPEFANGRFMYAVDENNEIWIGKRLPGPRGEDLERVTGVPHPTLIGGKNPKALAAGMVEIRGGKIYSIDNHSGHYKPDSNSMRVATKVFTQLPSEAFHPDFVAQTVKVDPQGVVTFSRFRSLNLLKLKLGNIDGAKFLGKFKWTAIKGKMKSQGFKSGVKSVGAVIGMLLFEYLAAKLMEWVEKKLIAQQIEKLGPAMQEQLGAHSDELDALLAEDPNGEVYMNMRFAVLHVITRAISEGSERGGGRVPEVASLPMVELIGTGYSRTPWDPTSTQNRYYMGCFQGTMTVDSLTLSEKVPVKELLGEDEPPKPPGG